MGYAIRMNNYKYTEWYTETQNLKFKELYDLSIDPYEMQSVAYDPSYKDIRNDLAKRLKILKVK